MAKRIKLGRCAELPICALGGYVASGLLLCIGGAQPFGTGWRVPVMVMSIIAFLAGVAVQVLNKVDDHNAEMLQRIDEHNAEMLQKIEDSVGDVWDSGERAGVRHEALRQMDRHEALVRRSEPRLAVVPNSGSF